jgi:ABC-type transporter Mla MlaB component
MLLPEVVTLANARAVRDMAISALSVLAKGAKLAVDASKLRKFDSGLLTVLLELQRGAKLRGVHVFLSGATEEVRERLAKLAQAYGMSDTVTGMLPAA